MMQHRSDSTDFNGCSVASDASPGLLVSVRSVHEAVQVGNIGVPFIDLKEPDEGPLGACDPDVWRACVPYIKPTVTWSLALGEPVQASERASLVPPGFKFAKAGLSGLQSVDQVVDFWKRIQSKLPPSTQMVAVAYADSEVAGSLAPEAICELADDYGLRTFLLDTFNKSGSSSLETLGLERLQQLASDCRQKGMNLVLAGKVSLRELALFQPLVPLAIGVRGAVCRGGREGTIDLLAVQEWMNAIRVGSVTPSGNPSPAITME